MCLFETDQGTLFVCLLFLNKRPDIIRQIEPTVFWQDFALFRVALTKSFDTFFFLYINVDLRTGCARVSKSNVLTSLLKRNSR